MDIKQKRKLITQLVELMLYCGYDISDLMLRNSSYFDYDKVKISIAKYEKEKKQIEGIWY